MRLKLGLILAVVAASLSLRAADVPYVTRGAVTRQGPAWVQFLTCQVPTKEGGRLVLRADTGAVTVRPGPSEQVGCQVRLAVYAGSETEARAYLDRYEFAVRRAPNSGVVINARLPYERHYYRSIDVKFSIQTPARFNLDLETQSGGVDIAKLDGELRASTAGGDIRTGDVSGAVRVRTAGGCIDLGNIGQRVDAATAGGPIRVGDVKGDANLETSGGDIVAGLIQGSLRAQTAGGSIFLRAASGPVVVQTAGGQIQLGQCGDTVYAETAAGSIRLDGARGMVRASTAGGSLELLDLQGAVRAETAAGRILCQISASRSNFAPSELESTIGDVQVYVPIDLPMTIDAGIDESVGHSIFSDFPLSIEGMQQAFIGGRVRARGSLLGGGHLLRLHTTMGNIDIKKLDDKASNQLKDYQKQFWKRWQAQWDERGAAVRQRRFREHTDGDTADQPPDDDR